MTNENTSSSGSLVKRLALPLGPILATIFALALRAGGLELDDSLLAGVTLWCAVWWVTEPVPVPATSLIPLALLPTLGLLDHKSTANAYGDSLILLLMGGFMLSRSMECTGAHKKVAIAVVQGVARLGGHGGRSVILGFMIATAALSMWISNTATTLMMLPVALAVISGTSDRKFAIPLLLGIAYAANIGGIGTPIGTPPNIIFMGAFDKLGVRDGSYGFLEWMKAGVPVVVLFVPIAWWWLTRGLSGKETFDLPKGESWTPGQRRVLFMFAMAAGLWIFQKYPALPIGWFTAQGLEDGGGGWTGLLRLATGGVIDARGSGSATVAALVVVALFSFPDSRGGRLLDWAHARTIPWGVLLCSAAGSHWLRLQIDGVERGHRRQPHRHAGNPDSGDGRAGLSLDHLPDRDHQQHRTHRSDDADSGRHRDGDGYRPGDPDGSGGDERELRLHVAGGHRAERRDLRHEDVPINRMMREGFVLNLIGVAIISTLAMFLVSKASEGVDASLVSPSSFILPSDSDPSS